VIPGDSSWGSASVPVAVEPLESGTRAIAVKAAASPVGLVRWEATVPAAHAPCVMAVPVNTHRAARRACVPERRPLNFAQGSEATPARNGPPPSGGAVLLGAP